jgi:hypothetical protein
MQLAVTGITYITLDGEMYGNVHFKGCPESGGYAWKLFFQNYILGLLFRRYCCVFYIVIV